MKKGLGVLAQGTIAPILGLIGLYLDTEVKTLFRDRLADKHTFLSIVISVFRRHEKSTEFFLPQSEKIRHGIWIPIYLPS